MVSKLAHGAILGAAMIASVAVVAAVASNAAPVAGDQATYKPMQSIGHDLGSKSAIGYFLRESGECRIILMIAEKADPEAGPMPSAARLRLALRPGQGAGLDSAEGRSIDLTCGDEATTLTVRGGNAADAVVVTN
ncbi:MAG: hypothetical protein AB7S71_24160 [Dongiaceae bacterium]